MAVQSADIPTRISFQECSGRRNLIEAFQKETALRGLNIIGCVRPGIDAHMIPWDRDTTMAFYQSPSIEYPELVKWLESSNPLGVSDTNSSNLEFPEIVLPYPTVERMKNLLELLDAYRLKVPFLSMYFETVKDSDNLSGKHYKGIWLPEGQLPLNKDDRLGFSEWLLSQPDAIQYPELQGLLALPDESV